MRPAASNKMKEILAIIIVTVLLLPGCNNADEEKNDQLREKIIRVHDLAMDKIGYMYELEVKLEQAPAPDRQAKNEIEKAISHLKTANTMMFEWMHQYQTLAVDSALEIDNDYRRKQLLMITEVQQQTDSAILISEKLLKRQQYQ